MSTIDARQRLLECIGVFGGLEALVSTKVHTAPSQFQGGRILRVNLGIVLKRICTTFEFAHQLIVYPLVNLLVRRLVNGHRLLKILLFGHRLLAVQSFDVVKIFELSLKLRFEGYLFSSSIFRFTRCRSRTSFGANGIELFLSFGSDLVNIQLLVKNLLSLLGLLVSDLLRSFVILL